MISWYNEKQRYREAGGRRGRERERERGEAGGREEEEEKEEKEKRKRRRLRELLGMIFNTLYANETTVYRKHAASVSDQGRFICLSRR